MSRRARAVVSVTDEDSRRVAMYEAHYFRRLFGRQRKPGRRFGGPGEKTVLLAPDAGVLFVWRRFVETEETSP